MNYRWLIALFVAAFISCAASAEPACDLGAVKWSFASQAEAKALLGSSDGYVAVMSVFDRSARLKTDKIVDTAAYLAFVRAQALDWTAEQKAGLRSQACELSQKLATKKWALPAISDLKLIVTTGREEGNAAYTRNHAILFPASIVTKDGAPPGVLAHELFHVLSRELLAQNPKARDALYAVVDYQPLGAPFAIPEKYRDRAITNPDSYLTTHGIRVKLNDSGKEQLVVPFLFSNRAIYDVRRGGEFFEYLDFKLVPVERNGAQYVAVTGIDGVELIDISATNYLSHVGRNTSEMFHADEVLAANFALALGYRVESEQTPEIPRKLSAALSRLK